MKIVLTGGGTGGHFYPLIAIAEKLQQLELEEKILDLKIFYFGSKPYDKDALFDNNIIFEKVPAGRLTLAEFPKAIQGIFVALWKLYKIYPDVIIGKGGFDSFPTLLAARILRLPVIIHESDSVPGRVNLWAGKFAERVAVSFEEAGLYFPKEKVAWTGQPLRREIIFPASEGFFEYFNLSPSLPTILVLGGSQGAQKINETILEVLPQLTEKYQIIHQVGAKNLADIKIRVEAILPKEKRERYQAFDFLKPMALRMAAGAAKLVISRAGSTIFEIAVWGLPAIVIPLESAAGDHQRKNAFNYARAGAAVVLDEANLTPHLLLQEIENIFSNPEKMEIMKKNAANFVKKDAAEIIAKEAIKIALQHEK